MKIRLYPSLEQAVLLNKTFGSCRFLYNRMLAERKETFERLKNDRETLYTYTYKTEKEYKAEFEWLKEVDSTALQQARMNLEHAYRNFYQSLKGLRKGSKVGFPQFKSKKAHKDSFRSVMGMAVDFEKCSLKLIKHKAIPFKHKTIKPWYFTAVLKNVTVSKTPTGKYYASCLFEGEQVDFLEKVSLKLVQENDVIVVEDLSLKGMAQAMHLGKSVMDLGYGSFVNKLKYKAVWHDKTVLVADKWFASSKTCHVCGFVKKDLPLQERVWICPTCGTHLNRDYNAAVNLKNYGKKILTEREKFTPVDIESLAGVALQSRSNPMVETGNFVGNDEAKKSLASW